MDDFHITDKDNPDRIYNRDHPGNYDPDWHAKKLAREKAAQSSPSAADYLVCTRCGAESYTQTHNEPCNVCLKGRMEMPMKVSDMSLSERREIEEDMKGDQAYDEEKGK